MVKPCGQDPHSLQCPEKSYLSLSFLFLCPPCSICPGPSEVPLSHWPSSPCLSACNPAALDYWPRVVLSPSRNLGYSFLFGSVLAEPNKKSIHNQVFKSNVHVYFLFPPISPWYKGYGEEGQCMSPISPTLWNLCK